MFFLFILLLIIGAEAVFAVSLIEYNLLGGAISAGVHVIALAVSFRILTKNFRQRGGRVVKYKTGFYAMGSVIFLFVPAFLFLLPGIVYLITSSTVVFYIGVVIWTLQSLGIIYGIFYGRWNWKVHNLELAFENLPAEMDGTTIVQISDVHIGSFFNLYHKVKPALDKISQINPDYFFFTGDLVNNVAEEVNGWEKYIQDIKAKKGKFSILGNHDYGDYVKWEDEVQKSSNLQALISKHKEIGFSPLLNESVELSPGFYLLGVENWGAGGFKKAGKLKETMEGIPDDAFKLLLSHDPSHFDAEIVGTGIDLTLSGHTHGMQFGIERFGIKWSPVSFRYKKWAGLYQVGKQFLYVNRGFGYLGFPGRVGIYPEITRIILTKS